MSLTSRYQHKKNQNQFRFKLEPLSQEVTFDFQCNNKFCYDMTRNNNPFALPPVTRRNYNYYYHEEIEPRIQIKHPYLEKQKAKKKLRTNISQKPDKQVRLSLQISRLELLNGKTKTGTNENSIDTKLKTKNKLTTLDNLLQCYNYKKERTPQCIKKETENSSTVVCGWLDISSESA